MAKLIKKNKGDAQLAELRSAAARLKDGDYGVPVNNAEFSKYSEVLGEMESLRLTLLYEKAARIQTEEQNRTMVANITHDLKTPLALILGYTECLQAGMNDRDYYALIQKKISYMNELILKMLEGSKAETKDNTSAKERTDAKQYFNAEIHKYTALANSKNIDIVIKRIPDAEVFISHDQISRVMQNLMSNAIKHTPDGGIITVSFRIRMGYMHIIVKDNGAGITADKLPHIFEKYYTGDEARGSGSGTGLGLYITREFVGQNGGSISCKSKVGKGTSFDFTVPVYFEEIKQSFAPAAVTRSYINSTFAIVISPFIFCLLLLYYLMLFFVEAFLAVMVVLAWALLIAFAAGSAGALIYVVYAACTGIIPAVILINLGYAFLLLGLTLLFSRFIIMWTKGLVRALGGVGNHTAKMFKQLFRGGAVK